MEMENIYANSEAADNTIYTDDSENLYEGIYVNEDNTGTSSNNGNSSPVFSEGNIHVSIAEKVERLNSDGSEHLYEDVRVNESNTQTSSNNRNSSVVFSEKNIDVKNAEKVEETDYSHRDNRQDRDKFYHTEDLRGYVETRVRYRRKRINAARTSINKLFVVAVGLLCVLMVLITITALMDK